MKFREYLIEEENLNYVIGRFEYWLKKVWGDKWYPTLEGRLEYHPRSPLIKRTSYMAVIVTAPWPVAIGSHLLKSAMHYNVEIADRLLTEPKALIEKIVKHEVIHIGYRKHDRNFRDLAKEIGAPFSEISAKGASVEVQQKIGSKYVTIETFDDPDEAIRWGKIKAKTMPKGTKMRVKY